MKNVLFFLFEGLLISFKQPVTDTLNKINWRKNAQLISAFDFSDPCTDINHEKLNFF